LAVNKDDASIDKYYTKAQNEARVALDRRDKFTNWALTILGALVTLYIGSFSGKISIPDYWRFVLVVAFTIIELRFFFQSMIAYGILKRWRHLLSLIERYWFDGNPDIAGIKNAIRTFDHEKRIPVSHMGLLSAQILSGFILVLAIPTGMIANELFFLKLTIGPLYYLTVLYLVLYIIFEIISFKRYDQVRVSRE
jgi:hypothetical protein